MPLLNTVDTFEGIQDYIQRMEMNVPPISKEEYRLAAEGRVGSLLPSVTDSKLIAKHHYLLSIMLAHHFVCINEEASFEIIDVALRIAGYLKDYQLIENLFDAHFWKQKRKEIPYVRINQDGSSSRVFFQNNEMMFRVIWYAEYAHLKGLKNCLRKMKTEEPLEILKIALLMASSWGHAKVVQFLLKEVGEKIVTPDIFEEVVARGHARILLLLLKETTVEIPIDTAGVIFIDAIKRGYADITEILLENLQISSKVAGAALTSAFEYGDSKIILLCLEKNRLLFLRDTLEEVLISAVSNENVEIVRAILREKGTQISNQAVEGAFLKAIERRHLEIMQLLIGTGKGDQFSFFHKLYMVMCAVFKGSFRATMRFFWPKPPLVEAGRYQEPVMQDASLFFQRAEDLAREVAVGPSSSSMQLKHRHSPS